MTLTSPRSVVFITPVLLFAALLFPFLSNGQSLSISQVSDSTSTGCDTTNKDFYFDLSGSSTGLNSGDSVALEVNHDDGNGFKQMDKITVDGQGDYSGNWSHSWSTSGYKVLDIAAIGPNGNSDTIQKGVVISDSCMVGIDQVSDSSTYTSCDTTGEDIYFEIEGNSSGFSNDTLTLKADYDDGNGMVTVGKIGTYQSGYYQYGTWSHSWSSPGQKDVAFIVEAPSGEHDSLHRNISITDSCIDLQIDSFTDSSGGGICHLPGDSVHLKVEGSSPDLSSGDSVEIQADHGNGYLFIDKVPVSASGDFSVTWHHVWSGSGQRNIKVLATGPHGNIADSSNSLHIHSSCPITIDSSTVADTGTGNACPLVGDNIFLEVGGVAMGLGTGDSLDLEVDHDDGNGLNFLKKVPVTSNGGYSATWSRSWSNSGTKNIQIILSDTNGRADTVQEQITITDSCSSLTIDAFTDSSGAAGCDTTGESIHHLIDGSSSGLNAGDSIDLKIYPDTSAPLNHSTTVNSQGEFSYDWVNTWSSPGHKKLTVVATGPNGSADTAFHQLMISDSCAVGVSSVSDYDTNSTSACYTTGMNIFQKVQGQSSGYSNGDSLDLKVDHGDGNGFAYTDLIPVVSNGGYSAKWDHSWSSSGPKQVTIVVSGPNGDTDTIQNTVFISDSCSTIQGTVYLDQNGNCSYDSGEPLLNGKEVKVTHNNQLVGYGKSNNSGVYQVDVGAGQSPYEVILVDSGSYEAACPVSGSQQVSNPPASSVDFGLECPQNPDFSVTDAHIYDFRPGWETLLHMEFDGPGLCQDSLECVKAVLPSDLHPGTPDSIHPPYDAVNGDTVIWNMDSLGISDFQSGGLPVITDSNATLGDSLCIELILCASSDADPSNNSLTVCGEVVNSWDPNNKRVTPQGNGPLNKIAPEQRMTYTINFQNTGTAPAIDVIIQDTLDSKVLDPNSFQLVNSSHNVDKIDIEADSVFAFHFQDIMLPDSGASQPDSKGFVRFSIEQQPALENGTAIENNGAIFFDQNPPVITNSTLNTVDDPTSIEEKNENAALKLYPNPASERIHIRADEVLEGRIMLFDMTGRKLLDRQIKGKRSSIELNGISSGAYILSLPSPNSKKERVQKKIMIE